MCLSSRLRCIKDIVVVVAVVVFEDGMLFTCAVL